MGSTDLEREMVCPPPGLLGGAPMGTSVWKASGPSDLKLAVAVARSQQPTHPISGRRPFCLPGAAPAGAAGGPGEEAPSPPLPRVIVNCGKRTLFVSRRSKNASVTYKTVPIPSRTWLQVAEGRGKIKDKTLSAE